MVTLTGREQVTVVPVTDGDRVSPISEITTIDDISDFILGGGGGATTGSFEEVNLYPPGYLPDGLAMNLVAQGYYGWGVFKPLDPRLPINTPTGSPGQVQLYPNDWAGQASIVAGGNTVTRVTGPDFVTDGTWEGNNFFYYAGFLFKVQLVVDEDHLIVSEVDGDPVSFGGTVPTSDIWHYAVTNTVTTVNINGTAVTRVSGQPFIPYFTTSYINGVSRFAVYVDQDHLTLSDNLGIISGATCRTYLWLSPELTTLRVQGLNGTQSPGDEESMSWTCWPDRYIFRVERAGQGKYRPVYFACGENPAGTPGYFIEMIPSTTEGNPGIMTLGGQYNEQSVIVSQNSDYRNYIQISGAILGNPPVIQALSSSVDGDDDVGLVIDAKGDGVIAFTQDTGSVINATIDADGNFIAAHNLSVAGDAFIGDDLTVTGDATVGITLQVGTTILAGTTITATTALTAGTTLLVGTNATILGTMTVSGTSTFNGVVALNNTSTVANTMSFNDGTMALKGATSGSLILEAATVAGSNILKLPAGTTDFSATGGTGQVVKQSSAGGAFTVGTITAPEISGLAPTFTSVTVSTGTNLITSTAAFTNGAAANTGTLTNAPAVGNPTKWIPINDNGTTRYIPAW